MPYFRRSNSRVLAPQRGHQSVGIRCVNWRSYPRETARHLEAVVAGRISCDAVSLVTGKNYRDTWFTDSVFVDNTRDVQRRRHWNCHPDIPHREESIDRISSDSHIDIAIGFRFNHAITTPPYPANVRLFRVLRFATRMGAAKRTVRHPHRAQLKPLPVCGRSSFSSYQSVNGRLWNSTP